MKNKLKRLLSLLLVAALCLTLLPAAQAADNDTPFTDVPNGKWYTEAVNYAYANGLMSGTSDTTFGPNEELERGQLVTILYQLAGKPTEYGGNPFADVPPGKYYTKPVNWAVNMGVASGTSADTFSPRDKVTRQELAGFLYKFATIYGYDISAQAELGSFPDAGSASSWAKKSLGWAVAEGLISGDSSDGVSYLRPKYSTTRAQVACVIMAFFKNHRPQAHGEITIALNAELTGEVGSGAWITGHEDPLIMDLINDYNIVVSDQGGKLVLNRSVVKSMTDVLNEDGTKTFTVQINEGLRYNNGDLITAADFVAYDLIAMSPQAFAADARVGFDTIVGGPEYTSGEAQTISGLRLLDEYSFSVTVPTEYVPYFYDWTYASLKPLPLSLYGAAELTVRDDGQGAYLDGGSLSSDNLDASRWIWEQRISAGPYSLVELDPENGSATLQVNPYYAGNFEGRKPMIETIHLKYGPYNADAVVNGEVDFVYDVTMAEEIDTAKAYEAEGKLNIQTHQRNGYGEISFQCDFGPTQFASVRRAIAYLTDRDQFIEDYLDGYGTVINGPICPNAWMYRQSEAELNALLNPYAFSVDAAVAELEADGWVLDEEGDPYQGSGLRYKAVTAEEAADTQDFIPLNDGRILMPLRIRWASTEGNPVSELLDELLIQNGRAASVGMEIVRSVMSFYEMIMYMSREASVGTDYGQKLYGMYNLAVTHQSFFDLSFFFCQPGTEEWNQGFNTNYIINPKLDELSTKMVYEVESGNYDAFRQLWVAFIDEWNDCLPDFPLYVNIYHDFISPRVLNLVCNNYWDISHAVLYATVK